MISDREVKEAVEDFENYTSGTGKTMHDLAVAYLSAEMPEELKEDGELPTFYIYGFNEALRLCKLSSLKDKARIESLENEAIEGGMKYGEELIKNRRLEVVLRKIVNMEFMGNDTDLVLVNKLLMEISRIAKQALSGQGEGEDDG